MTEQIPYSGRMGSRRRRQLELDRIDPRQGRAAASADALRAQWSDTLRDRARHLGQSDRLLVELYFRHALSYQKIGQTLGRSRGTVHRRLAAVVRRLKSPLVAAVLEPKCPLPQHLRELGVRRFLRDESIRDLAKDYNVTRHQMQRQLQQLEGWVLRDRAGQRQLSLLLNEDAGDD